jgi:hypothetical protein
LSEIAFSAHEEPNWPAFYKTLSTYGPAGLLDLDEIEREYIAQQASETDAFWSD